MVSAFSARKGKIVMIKIVLAVVLASSILLSYEMDFTRETKCVVRQMKVYKDPQWVSKIELTNGKKLFFLSFLILMITEQVKIQFSEFSRAMQQHGKSVAAARAALKERFGNTYFYYYFLGG